MLLWNRGATPATITAYWAVLGYPASLRPRVRDLWAHWQAGTAAGRYAATVPLLGVVMVAMQP